MTPKSDLQRRLPILLAFAAIYLIWGSTYLVIRIGIETVPPFILAGVRFLLAGGALYAVVRRRGGPPPTARQWRWAALVGGLMMAGGNGVVTWAEQTVPSGVAALIITTMPIWMVLLDTAAYGGARPRAGVVVGLVLGFGGVVYLVDPRFGAVPPLGALALLFAAFSWANGSLLNRRAALPASPFLAAAMEMVAGGALLLVAATFSGEWVRLDLAAISTRSLLAFSYLVLFGSIVALSAYVYLLRKTSAAAVGTYAFVNPVIALLLGWLVGEPIGHRTVAGGALVIGAVVLIHIARDRAPRRGTEPGRVVDEPVTAVAAGE